MSSPINRKKFEDQPRLVAYNGISAVNRDGAYANIKLPDLLAASSLSEQDRAWVTEAVYGTLRMQGKHDYFLTLLCERPLDSVNPAVLDVLRLGLHQIFEMRTPDHAAVSATVALTRYISGESPTAFVNGVLRSAIRRRDELEAMELPLHIKYSHPEWVVAAYRAALKDESRLESMLAANNVPTKPHIVAWPGKCEVQEILSEGGEQIPTTRYGVYASKSPHSYAAIRERRAGVQDRGSQAIAEIFLNTASDVDGQLHWLDMCAGPGGKAAFIFNSLHLNRPQDSFMANEPSEHRAVLVEHVVPAEFVNIGRGEDLVENGEKFDRILIDAPCSGLGAFRRRPEARWRKKPGDVKELVALQRDLLDAGAQLLTQDGILAYVTCSPHNAETRAQVADFLYHHKEWELVNSQKYLSEAMTDSNFLQGDGAVQMWTDLHGSDAMYMALLRRKN